MSETFFSLYKALSMFAMPLGLAISMMIAATILIVRKWQRTGILLLLTALAWLWLWSTPVWSDFIRSRLESEYRYKSPDAYPRADAIVVLGGGVRGYSGQVFPAIDLNRASDRELFASQLFKSGKSRQIILSGGADPVRKGTPSASGMKIFLINLGIPARNIISGTRSRNTIENLEEVTLLVKKMNGRSILLVTSALHMKRAHWLFNRSGLTVIPAPTDFEVIPAAFSPARLVPDAEALENSSRAAREIFGLWFYKIRFR